MVTRDQLNVPSLTSAELLCRRVQLIKQAHAVSGVAPDYSSSELFLGLGQTRAGAVNPQLSDFVSKGMKAEAEILKEARKAKEEKAAAKKKGKGGGRLQSDPPPEG
eukprot:2476674-Amphidinium_carterae.1